MRFPQFYAVQRLQSGGLRPRRGLLHLLMLVSLITPAWFLGTASFPEKSYAYTARVDLTIDRQSGESYKDLVRRAEQAARAAVQQRLNRDILVTEVLVVITARSSGLVAPILELQVGRSQWKRYPDPRRWGTYFSASKVLLGLDTPVTGAVPPGPQGAPQPIQVNPGSATFDNPATPVPASSSGSSSGSIPAPPIPASSGSTQTSPGNPPNIPAPGTQPTPGI